MMKILLITPSTSRLAGGIFASVRGLTSALGAAGGVEISVLGLADRFAHEDRRYWNGEDVRAFTVIGPRSFGFAPGLADALARADADLLHLNGALWRFPAFAVSQVARCGTPVIVSPHGMLDPWALENGKLRKRVASLLFVRGLLERTKCLHALCEQETEAIRAAGLDNPVCQIPNGVALPDLSGTSESRVEWHQVRAGRRALLFLGRLHRKKGAHLLLEAWAEIVKEQPAWREGWLLVIAGWDEGGYERRLRLMVRELDLQRHVHFFGPCDEITKDALLRSADGLILPSQSEGLPQTVLEAWSYAVPVLMTRMCNLPAGFTVGAAMEISGEPKSMAEQLRVFLQLPDADRRAMGWRGRQLAAERFSWAKIAAEMRAVYEWVLRRRERPRVVTLA
jgi:glycosyltransferase involved in cell wall biosynthesis